MYFKLSISLLLLISSSSRAESINCEFSKIDRAQVNEIFRVWAFVKSSIFTLSESNIPPFQIANQKCLYTINYAQKPSLKAKRLSVPIVWNGQELASWGEHHEGDFKTLDGLLRKTDPFALSNYIDRDPSQATFFGMTSFDIWKLVPKLETRTDSTDFLVTVAAHEFFHTYQFSLPFFRQLPAELGVKELDTRPIRKVFNENKVFMEIINEEISLLVQAIKSDKHTKKRELAASFLDKTYQRRKKFYSGSLNSFSQIEPIGATLEGVAEWIRYQLILKTKELPLNMQLRDLDKDFKNYNIFKSMGENEARKLILNNKDWEKRRGFALVLLISQLAPDWQKKIHRTRPSLGESLLKNIINEKD